MGSEPYALSVHHFISSVGADAGFASIIGLAVLVLLYFAQARETASLREQAEQSAQRVAHLESRLQQAMVAARMAPAVAPAPGPQSPAGAVPVQHPLPGVAAAPPAGVAAPPLSAATKLIPTHPAVGAPGSAAARIAASAGRSPVAASPGAIPAAPSAPPSAQAGATPTGATPAGVAPGIAPGATPTGVAPTGGGPAAPAPPRPGPGAPAPTTPPGVMPGGNRIVTPRPATAAGAGVPSNGAGEHPVIPPPLAAPPRPPVQIRPGGSAAVRPSMLAELESDSGRSSSDLTKVLTALAAVAVVAAIVIVLLSVTSGGTTARTTPRVQPPVSNAPAVQHHARPKPALSASSVTVGVLNGTPVYHLADTVATELTSAGFKQGTVANAATQTQPSTTVEYMPGDQRDAAAVAKDLKLSSAAVQPMTPDTQQLGCPQAGSCTVVVTVGADLAGTQNQTAG
ncbi:MAG TPA: LytR C-terminal domain-containing protein [Solirubrobacteraceae bacterium]|nr:LytR C-terminal domain-containing protein [Solirubrobacteraceae bacterium]